MGSRGGFMARRRQKMQGRRGHMRRALAGASVIALAVVMPASAQTADDLGAFAQPTSNAPLLLQADELVYNNVDRTISAIGTVRIDYDGVQLVADRVTYIEEGGRMVAVGNVEILEPDGNRLFADEIDITDDFSDGFLNALRVVTADNTRFAAESAERRDGTVTIFNNGLYTACEPCAERPEKAPIWQIKSQRTIWNSDEKTVRFEHARFEFLGVPIAYLPVFTTADPTVKRKTGFLAPRFRFAEELGFGVSVPYFIAMAPNYDLTLTGTGLTRQGFLGEAEFRHRLENGIYTLKIAGIHQAQPGAFSAGTVDSLEQTRGMIGTTGRFRINPRWEFGWNGMLQTDKNFARTYAISGFSDSVFRNEAWLTGLSGRNHFDARVMEINVQENVVDPAGRDSRQPAVLPSADYNYVVSRPVGGGELAFNVNTRGVLRDNADVRGTPGPVDDNFATFGVNGNSWRVTAETEWKRTFVGPGGLVITPILHAQGDSTLVDTAATGALSQTMEATGIGFAGDGTHWRGMATAGIEARWPLLVRAPGSTHVFEPMAQVFLRPNARNDWVLPNEDSQSLVFDASTLFDRDKFSGYDRIEGGVRANIGLRYNGQLGGGFSTTGVFGQSFHLSGDNPYADADLVNAGADSGLETDRSDYVGHVGLRHRSGFAIGADVRLDESDFDLRRAEGQLSFSNNTIALAANYALASAQPTYGFMTDRHEVSMSGSLRFADHWRVLASAAYDITNDRLSSNSIGLAYDDECFKFGLSYTETRNTADAVTRTYGIKFTARTLGDLGFTSSGLDF